MIENRSQPIKSGLGGIVSDARLEADLYSQIWGAME